MTSPRTSCIALLDVDHTLVLYNDTLNLPLLTALLDKEITRIYLFTDMNFHVLAIMDRNKLIKELEEMGFSVQGVITPSDVVWNTIDATEAVKLHHWCFTAKKYSGTFYGEEFDTFLAAHTLDFPNISKLSSTYAPEKGEISSGYAEACMEYHRTETLSDAIKIKSIFAKALCDHLANKCGYAHNKGLLLDLFLFHLPSWVKSIVVVDDNKTVCQDITNFRPVSLSPSAAELHHHDFSSSSSLSPPSLVLSPPLKISMIPVTSHNLNTSYYSDKLRAHCHS